MTRNVTCARGSRDAPATVDLWSFSLDCDDESLSRAQALLSEDEREQVRRFRFDRHRRRFVVRRAMRRVLLSGLVGAKPSEIRFLESERGKPRLGPAGTNLEFNTSHSGERGVIVTGGRPLGVDIEALGREIDYLRFARRCFTDQEYQDIRYYRGEERRMAFFNCWTGKEAYIKFTGAGLTRRLTSFSVHCALDQPPGLRWDEEIGQFTEAHCFRRYTDGRYVVTVVSGPASARQQVSLHELDISSLPDFESADRRTTTNWRAT